MGQNPVNIPAAINTYTNKSKGATCPKHGPVQFSSRYFTKIGRPRNYNFREDRPMEVGLRLRNRSSSSDYVCFPSDLLAESRSAEKPDI